MYHFSRCLIFALFISSFTNASHETTIPIHIATESGVGKAVGTIQVKETKYGLLFSPQLAELPPGIHGFHIHMHPSCDHKGMASGDHWDPKKTGKHLGPYNHKGHLGDLPAITVISNGTSSLPVLAPRLKHIKEIRHHALIIHEGGDNYSDQPAKLGGGGMRMFCGMIP